jgi:hypothetical protein
VVAALHLARPDPPGRTELRDLLEEVVVHVEEEGHPRHEVVGVEASGNTPLHVFETIDERERELLYRRRARLADVVAGDGDRVPLGHLARAEAEGVDDEVHRRPFGDDPLALRDVLLEAVVLDRASERRQGVTALLSRGEIHRPDDRGWTVDRHRRRDLIHRDLVEEDLHVTDRVDSDALAADLAARERIVGIATHQCRHVERGRETGNAMCEQVAKTLIGVLGRAEARELAHRPKARAVHRRMYAARVRELAGRGELLVCIEALEIVGRVQRVDRDLGERRESLFAFGALLHRRPVRFVEPSLLRGLVRSLASRGDTLKAGGLAPRG